MKQITLFFAFIFFSISILNAQTIKIAILDFENTSGIAKYDGLGKAMSSMLITDIEANVSPKRLQLVERSQIQKILKEQNFQATSAVDKTSSVKAGKLLGVKYLLVGDIYILNDVLVINARLTDTETGDIKFSKKQEGKLKGWLSLKTNIAKDLAKSFSLPFTESGLSEKEEISTIINLGDALTAKDEGKIDKVEELIKSIKLSSPSFEYLNELEQFLKNYEEERKEYESSLINKIMKTLSPTSPTFIKDVMYLLEKLNGSEHKSKTALALNEKIRSFEFDFNKKVYDGTFDNYLLSQKVESYINLMNFDEAINTGKICLNKYPNTSTSKYVVAEKLKKIIEYQKKIEENRPFFNGSITKTYFYYLKELSEFYAKNTNFYYNKKKQLADLKEYDESIVNESAMSYIEQLAQDSKDFKTFVKEVKKEYNKIHTFSAKESEAWLKSVYDFAKANESLVNETKDVKSYHQGDEYFLINVMDSIEYKKIRLDFFESSMLPSKNIEFPETVRPHITTISFFNLACVFFDIQHAEDIQDYFKSKYKSSDTIMLFNNKNDYGPRTGYYNCFIGESAFRDSSIVRIYDQSRNLDYYNIATKDLLLYFDKKIAFIKSIENKQNFLMGYKSNPTFNYREYKAKYKYFCSKEIGRLGYGRYFKGDIRDTTDYVESAYLMALFENAEMACRLLQYNEEISIRTYIINHYKIPKSYEIAQMILIISAHIFNGDFENAEKIKIKLDSKYPENDWDGTARHSSDSGYSYEYGYIQK